MKKSPCRNQFVFALSVLTLCLFQPVLAQYSTEVNKIVSKVPLRKYKTAWTKAQVREWASGPAKEWLDKTAVFLSMLEPQKWVMSGPYSDMDLTFLRTKVSKELLTISSTQDRLDGLLTQPYNLVNFLWTLDELESLSDLLSDVANSGLIRGPSLELQRELSSHAVVMSQLQLDIALHQVALMNWYMVEVAPPKW